MKNKIDRLYCVFSQCFLTCVAVVFVLAFCGCGHTGSAQSGPKAEEPVKLPVDKTFTRERKNVSRQVAQKYIDALNSALKSGDFSPMKKVLPPKLVSPRAEEIFKNMRMGLAQYGTLESCVYYGMLDCTFYVDHLWKYRFVKETGDPRLPRRSFEVLYRVRVIHPEKTPLIVKADFMFR